MSQSSHLRYLLCISLFLSLLLFLSPEVQCAVTKDEIGPECVAALHEEADYLYLQDIIPIQDAEGRKDLILLMGGLAGSGTTSLVALLREPKSCVIVLSGDGRGISAEKKSGMGYPDIYISGTAVRYEKTGALVFKDVKYFWNGKVYEDVTLKDRTNKKKSLNAQALQLFRQKKIEDAIKIWKSIDEKLDVADTEVLTNLGFAYYTLAKEKNDTRYYLYGPMDRKPRESTYYEKAEHYLQRALKMEPSHWPALLNMGDLEYDLNQFAGAIKRYEELLKVKPDYKFADTIKQRITELKRQPEKVGVEMVVTRYRSGEKGITYTRIDDKNVICQVYYKNGQVHFRENIVNGYENGEYKRWFEDGKLEAVGQQKMGEDIGKYISYHPDGSIHQVIIYKEGGTWVDVTKEYVK